MQEDGHKDGHHQGWAALFVEALAIKVGRSVSEGFRITGQLPQFTLESAAMGQTQHKVRG